MCLLGMGFWKLCTLDFQRPGFVDREAGGPRVVSGEGSLRIDKHQSSVEIKDLSTQKIVYPLLCIFRAHLFSISLSVRLPYEQAMGIVS